MYTIDLDEEINKKYPGALVVDRVRWTIHQKLLILVPLQEVLLPAIDLFEGTSFHKGSDGVLEISDAQGQFVSHVDERAACPTVEKSIPQIKAVSYALIEDGGLGVVQDPSDTEILHIAQQGDLRPLHLAHIHLLLGMQQNGGDGLLNPNLWWNRGNQLYGKDAVFKVKYFTNEGNYSVRHQEQALEKGWRVSVEPYQKWIKRPRDEWIHYKSNTYIFAKDI